MDTNTLVSMVFENVKADQQLVIEAQAFIEKMINGFITINAELVVSIQDETQFFAVLDGVLSQLLPNSQIETLIDAKLPFYIKPFEGIEHGYVEKYRAQFQLAALNFIKTQLEKLFGINWFQGIQEKAKAVIDATAPIKPA